MDARWWMMWHCPWWTCEQLTLPASNPSYPKCETCQHLLYKPCARFELVS